VGILSCLEEECVAPKGSDGRFLDKLNKFCDKDNPEAKYKSTRFGDGFVLKHYAGDVEYSVNGWIEKNKDPLNEDITRLLARSSQKHVALLFEDYLSDETSSNASSAPIKADLSSTSFASMLKLRKGSGSFRTVGQRHKQQLLALMNTLYMTHPHFVRCILPNDRKHAGEIQAKLVLDQLRCNGVLEGIRICRKGFPNRLSFDEFRKRYQVLCPDLLDREAFTDGRTACQMLVKQMKLDNDKYQIGTTKVFFKATVLAELEELRDAKLSVCITKFQAFCRGRMARQYQTRFSRQTDAIRIMQRNARIYVSLREWPWWKIYAKLKPLNEAYRIDTQMREKEQKISALETELKDQNDALNDIISRNQELESEHLDFKELIMAEQSVIRELEDNKEDLLAKLTLVQERVEELELELHEKSEQSEQQRRAHAEEIEELHTQLDTSKLINDRQAGELERTREDNAQLQAQVTEEKNILQVQVSDLQKEHKAATEKIKENEYKLLEQETVQKETITNLQTENIDLKNNMSNQELEIERLEKELLRSQENEKILKESDIELAALKSELQNISSALDKETKLKLDWQSKYDHLIADWDDLIVLVRAESDQAKARVSRFVSRSIIMT
jgi:myosin heavy subunit